MTQFEWLPVVESLGQKLGVAEANLAIAQAQIQALTAALEAAREGGERGEG